MAESRRERSCMTCGVWMAELEEIKNNVKTDEIRIRDFSNTYHSSRLVRYLRTNNLFRDRLQITLMLSERNTRIDCHNVVNSISYCAVTPVFMSTLSSPGEFYCTKRGSDRWGNCQKMRLQIAVSVAIDRSEYPVQCILYKPTFSVCSKC
jgi:hypothetical protein